MKKFSFRLDRILSWRHTQVRLEEAKLERLNAELAKIDRYESALRAEHAQEEKALLTGPSATGAELAALEHYRRANVKQCLQLHQMRQECNQRIATQMQEVSKRRQDAKLLEKLKE